MAKFYTIYEGKYDKSVFMTGDLDYKDKVTIQSCFDLFSKECPCGSTLIIHGGCKGADELSSFEGNERDYMVDRCCVNGNKFGSSTQIIKNKIIIATHPNIVCIFYDKLGKNRGTKSCIKQLLKEISEDYSPTLFLNGKLVSKLEMEKMVK
jgi:hypothetical protein